MILLRLLYWSGLGNSNNLTTEYILAILTKKLNTLEMFPGVVVFSSCTPSLQTQYKNAGFGEYCNRRLKVP